MAKDNTRDCAIGFLYFILQLSLLGRVHVDEAALFEDGKRQAIARNVRGEG